MHFEPCGRYLDSPLSPFLNMCSEIHMSKYGRPLREDMGHNVISLPGTCVFASDLILSFRCVSLGGTGKKWGGTRSAQSTRLEKWVLVLV